MVVVGGGGGPCEGLRYKQVNDFLLALRLFPHLTAWKGLWNDGLEGRPFAQQPSSSIWCRRPARILTLLLAPLATVHGQVVGVQGLNLCCDSHLV